MSKLVMWKKGVGLWPVLLLAVIALSVSSAGAADSKLQDKFDGLDEQATRARGLALSILKQIKQIDKKYRSSDGTALTALKSEAQQKLGRIEKIKGAFEGTSDGVIKGLAALSTDVTRAGDDPIATALKPAIARVNTDMGKYARAVDKYYDRSVKDFGRPSTGPMAIVAPTAGDRFSITGEAMTALGSGTYKRPNAIPSYKASTSDISFGIKGRYIPAERTNILFNLDRQARIERREIATLNFGVAGVRQFSDKVTATAGLKLSKFTDKDDKDQNFSTTGLFAKIDHQSGGRRFGGELQTEKRNYSENDVFDFSTTSLLGHVILPRSDGSLNLNLKYLKRNNDDLSFLADHTEFNPSVLWKFDNGGKEAGLSYQKISHPDLTDSPLDNTRIKAHLDLSKQDGTKNVRYGPAVMIYQFPNIDDGNFYDFKFKHHTSEMAKKSKTRQIDAVYRMHKDSTQFDFAQVSLSRESRPTGSGRYSRLNLAARFYVETSYEVGRTVAPGTTDTVSLEAYAEPHTLDMQYTMGWLKTSSGWYRMLTIGPLVGAKFYVDPNGEDKSNKETDTDYNLKNPRNFARAGVEVVLAGNTSSGLSWRGDASYSALARYNADPMTTTNYIKINGRVTYPVAPEWKVEGFMRFQSTKMSEKSSTDLERFEIGVQARYLFDVRR